MDNARDTRPKGFKVIIVGPQAVGKSSILFRLTEARFNPLYLATVGIDFKTYTTKIGDKSYSLQIWDTAGQEKFRALTSTYYKGSQGCVCVFDLSDLSTVERCQYYLSKAVEQGIPKQCVLLIGNKEDMPHENSQIGKQLAEKYGIEYWECSALEGAKVVEAFDHLAAQLVRNHGEGLEDSGSKPKINIKEGNKKCCGS